MELPRRVTYMTGDILFNEGIFHLEGGFIWRPSHLEPEHTDTEYFSFRRSQAKDQCDLH